MILDLVPFAGSTAAAVLGAYMAWEARNLGMSKWQMTRMAGNIGVDWLLGLIPWVGAIPDFFFRSNTPQPADHQAPPRQASPGRRDHRGPGHWPQLLTEAVMPASRLDQSPLIPGSMIGLPTSPCPTVRPAISSIRSSGTRARSMTSAESSIRGWRSRSAT